jgi:hypothetical protein
MWLARDDRLSYMNVLVIGPMKLCPGGHPDNGVDFVNGIMPWLNRYFDDKSTWPVMHSWPVIYWGAEWTTNKSIV